MATKKPPTIIELPETEIGQIETGILGITPYLHNRMSEKARRTLLYPSPRKNAAERAANLKHDPVTEFRSSPYTLAGDEPTLLAIMASSLKGAMMTAALDLPGASKAQIGRLVWIEGHYLPLWGDAKLHMAITRSADIGKTPDVRTRAITPEWGTVLTISFVMPLITQRTVMNLLSTGGRSAGVGDWRAERGKGTFGQFKLCSTEDPELQRIQKFDRARQVAALEAAQPYDAEADELLTWFDAERRDRGR